MRIIIPAFCRKGGSFLRSFDKSAAGFASENEADLQLIAVETARILWGPCLNKSK
jgi:hypothetical protein